MPLRPFTPSVRARSYSSWRVWPYTSTPPALCEPRRAARPPFAACGSDGPLWSLGSQWSPTFSNECFTAENAVRWARSPSPYVSAALSCVLIQVSCAFLGERFSVPGRASRPGMVAPPVHAAACEEPGRTRAPCTRARCYGALKPQRTIAKASTSTRGRPAVPTTTSRTVCVPLVVQPHDHATAR